MHIPSQRTEPTLSAAPESSVPAQAISVQPASEHHIPPAPTTTLATDRESHIYDTVLDLLTKHGYERLTMAVIATAAQSSTATLYRHWDGKAHLVVSAIRTRRPHPFEEVDTGNFRTDLIEGLERAVASEEENQAVMSVLFHASKTDVELASIMQELLKSRIDDIINLLLSRATARGEIAADNPAREFLTEILVAGASIRRFFTGEIPDTAYLTRYVDFVIMPALASTNNRSE